MDYIHPSTRSLARLRASSPARSAMWGPELERQWYCTILGYHLVDLVEYRKINLTPTKLEIYHSCLGGIVHNDIDQFIAIFGA